MSERKIKMPEFLKKKDNDSAEAEKTELDMLKDAYMEKFGDNDYTTIFIESDEEYMIRTFKRCLNENRRFDDVTGISKLIDAGNLI